MKKLLQVIALSACALSVTSCATFLNDNYKQVTVFSNIKDASITINDSLYANPASIKVKRDNKPLKFILKSDSLNLSKEYYVKNKPASVFFSGNIPMVVGAPFGIVIDLTNKRRFDYPKIIELNYFDENLSVKELKQAKKEYNRNNEDYIEDYAQEMRREERAKAFQRNKVRAKGDLVHNYILPGYTHYIINPEAAKFNTAGVLKVGYGIDYFYKDNMFVNTDLIFKTNLIDPLISLVFLERRIVNPELSVTNNHRFNRFEVGYGLSFQYFYYNFNENNGCFNCETEPTFTGELWVTPKPIINEGYFTLSPKIKTAYQLNRKLYAGLFYQPSLLKFTSTTNNTKVDHIFGIDFRFKALGNRK